LDRRRNTPDGSGGASPTVVTEPQDDDDLTVDIDEPTQILGTSSVRTATRSAAAKSAAAAKEAPVKEGPVKKGPAAPAPEASVNGSSTADEKDTVVADVPALPADTIRPARNSFTFSRSVSAPVSPGADEDWMRAENGVSSPAAQPVTPEHVTPEPATSESVAPESITPEPVTAELEPQPGSAGPLVDEPPAAQTGTGWPVGTSLFDAGTSTAADPPPAQPSSNPEPATVSAAAFVWDAPEPAPTSPSSPARNFLRSNTNAKTAVPPRSPAVSVAPGKAQAGPDPRSDSAAGAPPAAGARSKGSAKRSARQAHLTIARVEPWSVMKFSFVVSLVAFVILFVAVSVIYGTLSALGVFTSLQHVVQSLTSSQDSNGVNAAKWFTASRVLSYTALLGALNIVLITAMSTIGAVVYNLTSRLIGGVEVTLRETE